ncbi:MAG: phosphatidylethanolamine N-methyltransferase family protein [Acidobacteriota bacterium]
MRPDLVFLGLSATWGVIELLLAASRMARGREAGRDRGSMLAIWLGITLGFVAGFWLLGRRLAPIPLPAKPRLVLATLLLLAGLALRFWAMAALGRLFTFNVAIRDRHELVSRGPYRWLRHPSYTGALMAFLALGLGLGDALALAALFVPVLAGMLYRIRVEERVLRKEFGEAWDAYAARRWRLVPGLW